MNDLENMGTREALNRLRNTMDDLYIERRDHIDVIKSQEKQLKMMRESVEYANDLKKKADYMADFSFYVMYMALVVAFIAVGYAVCFG